MFQRVPSAAYDEIQEFFSTDDIIFGVSKASLQQCDACLLWTTLNVAVLHCMSVPVTEGAEPPVTANAIVSQWGPQLWMYVMPGI